MTPHYDPIQVFRPETGSQPPRMVLLVLPLDGWLAGWMESVALGGYVYDYDFKIRAVIFNTFPNVCACKSSVSGASQPGIPVQPPVPTTKSTLVDYTTSYPDFYSP